MNLMDENMFVVLNSVVRAENSILLQYKLNFKLIPKVWFQKIILC